MAEIAGGTSLTNEQRCKRSDGRGWRCRLPVAEGKGYCEAHIQQALLRQKRQPVPDHLKLERTKSTLILPKLEQEPDGSVTDIPVRRGKRRMKEASEDVSNRPRKTAKKLKKEDSVAGNSDQSHSGRPDGRKMKEASKDASDGLRKRAKKVKKEAPAAGASDQLEGGSPVVVDMKLGTMEIAPANSSSSSQHKAGSPPAVKVGAPPKRPAIRRPIRSKNSEPIPIPVVKRLPSISENVKAAAKKIIFKKKIIKKCHWCGLRSFCVLVKCSTCNKHFFCQECINKRCYCKKTVTRQCPVCQGECSCRACTRGKPKQVKSKELAMYDIEEDIDTEEETTLSNRAKMSDFDRSQQLHMIQELLPVMTMMNQEKIIELDFEAKYKGLCHDGLEVQIAGYTQKKECSFCKACIPDVHRSCDYCSFILCLVCCHDLRDGYLHSSIENLEDTKMIRSKSFKNASWRFYLDGRISCPPKNLGGCKRGLLRLTSFYPFCHTKDLEESAKQILCNFPLKRLNLLSDSSPCLLCDEKGEMGLYFSTKQEFKDNNLEHFIKHWGKGQPVVIRDVFQSQSELNWDFGFMLCEYLKKSAESRNNTETVSPKSTRDWCEVEFGRKQIFSRGITHENVWNEFLKFKLRFSSDFLQDHFPSHYNAIIQSLPVQEYMNPFVGFLNLGAYSPYQTKNPNLGSYISISYGGLDNLMNADLLSSLCFHAYDVVNVLVHATGHPIPERILNEVKMLMNKYNSQDHLKSSRKIANRNKLEGMFASSSRLDATDVDWTPSRLGDTQNCEVVLVSDQSESELDDEDFSQVVNSCGAQWDIFRREDVPMLLEYLRKYSDKLSRSCGSLKKVIHPLFDEVFYLDDDHKARLKEEFNVDALSFEQDIGEAVIIPAGCPYQMKKIKSCVNVVYEFMSPESALESIKVSDEIRLLPVNHKAKGNMVQVKEMSINRMHAAVEEMRKVFVSQPEQSWPFVISHSAKSPPS